MTLFNDLNQAAHETSRFLDEAYQAYTEITTTYPELHDQTIDTYYTTTQSYLHSVREFATTVDTALDATTTTGYQPSNTTTQLRDIIDGETSHTWNNRYHDFTDVLPDTYGAQDAAYLHGYLDANTYLNENHDDLYEDFQAALNDVTRRRY